MKVLNAMLVALFIGMLVVPTGCEDDSSRGSSSSVYWEMIEAETKNYPPGAIVAFANDEYSVCITDNTSISKQRDSCSGTVNASPSEINIGDILEFVVSGEIDYSESPAKVWTSEIRVFRPECLENKLPPRPDPCPTKCGCDCNGTCDGSCDGTCDCSKL